MTAMRQCVLGIAAAAALMSASCSGGGEAAVPRPEGYPRIEAYPESYTRLEGTTFEVNDSARVVERRRSADDALWVTLRYPRYGGALFYLTFTPVGPSTINSVLDNRAERMALNAGGGASVLTDLVSDGGYNCRVMTTPAGTVTPVQFLASSPGMVVSGALFVDGAANATSPDSLRPVVEAVERDVIHGLKHLQ